MALDEEGVDMDAFSDRASTIVNIVDLSLDCSTSEDIRSKSDQDKKVDGEVTMETPRVRKKSKWRTFFAGKKGCIRAIPWSG
jgi:hypothetical protein